MRDDIVRLRVFRLAGYRLALSEHDLAQVARETPEVYRELLDNEEDA